jgi:hypothetical protein
MLLAIFPWQKVSDKGIVSLKFGKTVFTTKFTTFAAQSQPLRLTIVFI